MGFENGDFFAYFVNSSASEGYSSNFVGWTKYPYTPLVTIPFTFGVPFVLTLADNITFSGSTAGRFSQNEGSFIEDITAVDVTYTVFDSDGIPVNGATIAEVLVPEVSSAWLLITMAAWLGLCRALRGLPSAK
jgi:hypothetical protein